VDRLAVAARVGDPAALRRALAGPTGRAALALAVPTLPAGALGTLLTAAREVPVRGVLASALLGLLGHPAAGVRRAALGTLGETLADDRRDALLEAALWLARRDPDASVRRVALAVLAAGRTGAPVQARLLRALADPDPSVRVAAIPLALRRAVAPAREHLLRRLPEETPEVRAASFAALLRRGTPGLPVAVVAAGLADVRPVPAPARRDPDEPVPPHAGDRTVQEAVLSALEARLGVRHQGPPGRRAERWLDDLHRYGWSLPARPE
jgi:hypothetical protein